MEERREDCGEEVESLDLLLYTILYSYFSYHSILYRLLRFMLTKKQMF
jgi:hypothetical protein